MATPVAPSEPSFSGRAACALSAGLLGLYLLTHLWQPLVFLETGSAGVVLVLMPVLASFLARFSPRGRRNGFVVLLLLTVIATAFLVAGMNPVLAGERLVDGVAVVVVLVSCAALGARLLTFFGILDCHLETREGFALVSFEMLVFSLALGLGSLSLLTLLLGLAGWLSQGSAVIMLGLMAAAGYAPLRRVLDKSLGEACLFCESATWLNWSLFAALLLIVVMQAPGAFSPPLDYDVVEYHVQFPREYFDAGQIRHLPHSVFSGFPQASEMLTLFSFSLADGYHGEPLARSHGIWIAKLLNLAFLPLLLAGAALTVMRLSTRETSAASAGGLVAALLIAGTFQTLALAMKLYVELAMTAYVLLSVLALACAWRDPGRFLRYAALAGFLAGAAAGCKYTGLLFAGLPVVVLFMTVPVEGVPVRNRIVAGFLAGLLCWAVLSPWLVKNAAATGNPFYPLFNATLRVDGWTDIQAERFRRAHRSSDHSLPALIREGYRVAVGGQGPTILGKPVSGDRLGLLALIFIPGLLCATGRKREVLALAGWMAGGFFLWFFLTHRLERFFYSVHVLGAILSGLGAAAAMSASGRVGSVAKGLSVAAQVIAVMVVVTVLYVNHMRPVNRHATHPKPVLSVLLGTTPVEGQLASVHPPFLLREAMKELPDGARVMLVGTADPFWLPSNVEYAIVFNRHPFYETLGETESAETAWNALCERGITHVFVNWPELARLHATYYKAYELPEDAQRRLHGVLTEYLSPRNGFRPLTPPWGYPVSRVGEDNARLAKLIEDYGVLFPEGRQAGRYALAPYELFSLLDRRQPVVVSAENVPYDGSAGRPMRSRMRVASSGE